MKSIRTKLMLWISLMLIAVLGFQGLASIYLSREAMTEQAQTRLVGETKNLLSIVEEEQRALSELKRELNKGYDDQIAGRSTRPTL